MITNEAAYPPDALTTDALSLIAELKPDRGSVEDLAAILPNSRLQRVPGDHFTALISTELRERLADFLSEDLAADVQAGSRRP